MGLVQEVDGHSFVPVRMDGPYTYRNLESHRYNKNSVDTSKKGQPIRGNVLSGVELSFKPHWANGVVVHYNILQSQFEGFTKLPGSLFAEVPNQHFYEAQGTSRPLAVGEAALIRLTCNINIPVEQCPYHLALTLKQVN